MPNDDRARLTRALLSDIAMDIGKEVVAHVKVMYPDAISSTESTFPISLRNHIYNQIMAAFLVGKDGEIIPQVVTTNERGEILHRLTERATGRRKSLAQWVKLRENSEKK